MIDYDDTITGNSNLPAEHRSWVPSTERSYRPAQVPGNSPGITTVTVTITSSAGTVQIESNSNGSAESI